MNEKIAFIIVGHSNWGKSKTLKELTNGSIRKKWLKIGDRDFFIKRMSNDDDPELLLNFVKEINKRNIIITFCPNFTENGRKSKEILEILISKDYKLNFYVLKYCFIDNRTISDFEINELKKLGKVEILDKKEEDKIRAKLFKNFVENELKILATVV